MNTILTNQHKHLLYSADQNPHNQDFTCVHCRYPVSASALVSRVQNRNHCPYCLWSRHLDLFKPGDRLSACKGKMRPIGLAFKREKNRYAASMGELMIVHQCSDCGKLSVNRSAADDDPDLILALPGQSTFLSAEVTARLEREGIDLVLTDQLDAVRQQLEGALLAAGEY